jgi:putative holliday junction resolvase
MIARILGMDFGSKRIGLSISDPLGYTAQSLETLENKSNGQWIQVLRQVCQDNKVSEIVIGLPVNMNGSMGPKAQEVLQLVPCLEEAIGVPIRTWDERLTSRQADRLMIEEGLSRRKQKNQSDKLAAILILQGYLDSKRLSK